ncbi:MAG TPA: oxidoreductase, partial [Bacteroidetes bacterium]|nr:oxidoreductase [Bacteroidota bacterium]
MKQALVKKGIVYSEEVPAPVVSDGFVLIKVVNSCISAGTEMAGVLSSGTPLIKRILKQPEKITKAINLIRSEGFDKAYKQISGEMEAGKPTGYSVSGIVIGTGKNVEEFQPGDQVAAGGGGYAHHAEYVEVPKNLVVKMPEKLEFKDASTVALGAIAMHGIHRANLTLGEFCVVFGTGILGLLTVQMLAASGIRVIAIDLDPDRLKIAEKTGAEFIINANEEDPVKVVLNITNGYGTDAVIFTASTSSNTPLSQSFQMTRKKGKVILVGVSGMEIKRQDIYQKEIDFLISTSYGPGRYDRNYELKGIDYPYHFVRWTERRNFSEYLRLLQKRTIDLSPLISKVFSVENITKAFQSLENDSPKPLMVILDYGKPDNDFLRKSQHPQRVIHFHHKTVKNNIVRVAIVGTGSFATHMHLPNLFSLKNKFLIRAVVDNKGHKAKAVAEQYGAHYATTDFNEVLNDAETDLVLICTRHDNHGALTLQALQYGKHVFVEKPLATKTDEVEAIEQFYNNPEKDKPLLMVGFNRRFSRYAREIKKYTDKRINPLFIHYRMNAGYIPADHWVHENGGRIVGEACHIIDLMSFFTGSPVTTLHVETLSPTTGKYQSSDNKSIILKYQDGSVATIEYFAVGSRELPKEYMEIHYDEKSIIMEDYKSLKGYGSKITSLKTAHSEKGHLEELERLHKVLIGETNNWPIPLEEILQTSYITLT